MNERVKREVVRVIFHENGQFTRVLHEATEGVGMADGGIQREIPTSIIPEELRAIGSRFQLVEDPDFQQHTPVNPIYRHLRVERLS